MTAPTAPELKTHLTGLLRAALPQEAAALPELDITLERPKQAQHGDYASNIAMQLAKRLRANPRNLASAIIAALPASPLLEKAELAGAGFINLHLKAAAKQAVVGQILDAATSYGSSAARNGRRVQVEFVSANPTGPLHVGHGRGAAYGATLSNLLSAVGYEVTREYYVNDAGRQMDILALSCWLRYLELNGVRAPFPANAYQGDYVKRMAQAILAAHGNRHVRGAEQLPSAPPASSDSSESAADEVAAKQAQEAHLDALIEAAKRLLGPGYLYFHDFVLNEQLVDCREDLLQFGVSFDVWFSEKSLFDSGLVARAVERLEAAGHVYSQDGAKWFRATGFGDEKDRVVQRENGQYTYFASDIAYHMNKFERGFDRLIDVWGADHHGYVPRVRGALSALGLDADRLTVALVQFAVLYRGGEKVSMSTRSGEFVTLRELRTEVGNDAARFFYVLRKSDQHLDFDLDLAKSQSNENPVYYVQYAHARICSVLQQGGADTVTLRTAAVALLQNAHEMDLLLRLMEYPEVIAAAARELAPHLIAFYLKDLAASFHSYYNAAQFLVEDQALKIARLSLITATRQVLANGLGVLGVSAPEKM